MNGGVLGALRAHTQDVHNRVDRHVDIMRTDVTRDEYQRFLQLLFGFHAPVEAWLAAGGATRVLPDWAGRRKVRWLAADLAAMGVPADAQAALPRIPPLEIEPTRPAVAGVLYVIEGSTFGGRVIAPHVRSVIPDVPIRFLSAYGSQTGPRWRTVRNMLETFDRDVDEVIAGAAGTFGAFEQWAAVGVTR